MRAWLGVCECASLRAQLCVLTMFLVMPACERAHSHTQNGSLERERKSLAHRNDHCETAPRKHETGSNRRQLRTRCLADLFVRSLCTSGGASDLLPSQHKEHISHPGGAFEGNGILLSFVQVVSANGDERRRNR